MKTVIFGAGASYDCIIDFYEGFSAENRKLYRPPLTKDLFQLTSWYQGLQSRYKGVTSMLAGLRSAADVEAYLQQRWEFAEENDDRPLAARLINIQFYLQHVLSTCSEMYSKAGTTNYEALVERARDYAIATKEDVLFITFNYDLLLESALMRWYGRGSEYMNIEDYIQHPIKLIKPHGSCNWYRSLRKRFISGQGRFSELLMNSNLGLRELMNAVDGPFEAKSKAVDSTGNFGMTLQPPLLPQLLIPMQEKDELVLPDKHLDALVAGLTRTTHLLIIGWRAGEKKFLSLLREHIGSRAIEVEIVCRKSGHQVRIELMKHLPSAKFHVFNQPQKDVIPNQPDANQSEESPNGDSGTFSSYIRLVAKREWNDFFAI